MKPQAVAQFLPRDRFERGKHVADHLTLLLRHEHGRVVFFELAAQEPLVAAFGITAGCDESLGIERVMRPQQHRAQASQAPAHPRR